MLGTLGIVQLCLSHQGETFARRMESLLVRQLADKNMLQILVRRVTDAQRLDGVIALTGTSDVERRLAEQVPADVPVLHSAAADPLAACAAALREFPCNAAVLVDVDAPFVDPDLLDRLVITAAAHPGCDYISYRLSGDRPMELSNIGVFGQWCKSEALRRCHRLATGAADRREPARYMHSHPEQFQLRLLASPPQLDRPDVRLRIRCEDDWDHAAAIVDALGPELLQWRQIAHLLDDQPALRERMAVLNQAGT